jgi:hypothetical protein
MAKFLRQYDPSETKRRVTIEISEDVCPGMLEALSVLPYGHETPLIRAVMYQWILDRQAEGALDEAMLAALAGPGGRPDGRRPNKMAMGSAQPARRPVAKVAKPTRVPVQTVQSVRRSEDVQVQEPVLVSSSPQPVLSTTSAQPVLAGNLDVTPQSAPAMAPSASGPPVATPDHTTPVDVSALTAGELEGISELDTMFN